MQFHCKVILNKCTKPHTQNTLIYSNLIRLKKPETCFHYGSIVLKIIMSPCVEYQFTLTVIQFHMDFNLALWKAHIKIHVRFQDGIIYTPGILK